MERKKRKSTKRSNSYNAAKAEKQQKTKRNKNNTHPLSACSSLSVKQCVKTLSFIHRFARESTACGWPLLASDHKFSKSQVAPILTNIVVCSFFWRRMHCCSSKSLGPSSCRGQVRGNCVQVRRVVILSAQAFPSGKGEYLYHSDLGRPN